MAAPQFTIWGRLNSHNVKKVAWFAEELGLNYVRHDIGGQFGYTDEYLAKNPNRLVPMIEDGKLSLWESNAILRYMAAEYGGERWFQHDPIDRALADRWMDWQITYAEAQRLPFLAMARTPREQWDIPAIARDVQTCIAHLNVLERALSDKPWLSGGQFGIGDIPMGVYAHTWFSLPLDRFGLDRPEFPAMTAWYARLRERKGYAQQVMIPLT
ncbi:MAG: glutathione S-transferase [Novosphingobium lindaniclasticum]|jgi:glutathione S-transferase|uniref:Glutathione S-transferase n=1 Tax=Novosphingobium lindaniclasticum LE124 TaxID=1096930 RepID=T0IE46_9SPHN|nr:glutathione S-transferase N-terminal domain-containing protein [Novosphingobium lindaniclasticum]EQB09955.1 glutathione S-transferase [Novosphingobium lindaniclasticum LE124]MDF2638254.1 glutathione S-transferase [Novosphingobium lindaniclasticum]